MKPYQIIFLGQEGAGNHAICSLFSKMENTIGTDLCGWEGEYVGHNEEKFNLIWWKLHKLNDTYSDGTQNLVTSRSIPCGFPGFPHRVPDLDGFLKQCDNPVVVVIGRDQTIVQKATEKYPDRVSARQSLQMIKDLIKRHKVIWFSYEIAIAFKELYIMPWIENNLPGCKLDAKWINYLRDENVKYII